MYIGRYTDKLLEENRQLKKKIATYESDTALAQMKALCDKRVQGAADREKRNYDNWMKALEVNKELKKKNTSLWQEKEKYLWELKSLRRRNEILEENNEHRLTILRDVQEERDQLKEETADKDKQIAVLKEEICKLKARLDHDGTTNGIPTSQTPIDKKKVIPNTRQKTGRKKGGQPGHEKKCMEAFDEEEITETVKHTWRNRTDHVERSQPGTRQGDHRHLQYRGEPGTGAVPFLELSEIGPRSFIRR